MSIINKIYLKNAQGENIEYDIAADAQNVQYDASHSIKDVVNNLDSDVDTLNSTVTSVSSTVSTHVAASVTSDDGIHDFRYNNGSLQVISFHILQLSYRQLHIYRYHYFLHHSHSYCYRMDHSILLHGYN